jgi:hypothetical protein
MKIIFINKKKDLKMICLEIIKNKKGGNYAIRR